MRIVKAGVLAPTNKGIQLGVQGENCATDVEFDTRPWFREYPSGTVSAVAKREGDPAPYPLTLDVADGTAVWHVSDTDTAKPGMGAVELTMTSGGARVRSLTFKTLVTASLTDAPVDDDAWYGWLDKAVVKVDETVQSAQRKMAGVDAEWTDLKADVTEKVEELGEAASQAAEDAHHAKVDAQATAKALESAEGSVAKADAAATRAEGSAEQAYGAASDANVSASNAATSATAAAKSASDAAASVDEMLTESKKYTDTTTSNALVNTVSGKLLHVEDAWPGKPLGLTIDGAYKQDGTPSPDNPVPIAVIENPVLLVTGRNLLDPSKMAKTWYGYVNVDGELQVKNGDGRSWADVPEYGVLPAGSYYIGGDSIEVRRAVDNTSLAYSTDGSEHTFKLDTATPVKIKVGVGRPDSQYPYVTHVMLLASSGNDVAYTPYVGESLPITLPAEHPYLAALPDGTHDEIMIDNGGNASLVARVSEAVIDASGIKDLGKGKIIYNFPPDGRHGSASFNKKAVISQVLKGEDADKLYKGTAIGISVGSPYTQVIRCDTVLYLGDGVDVSSVDGTSFYYPLMTPVTYPLGKLDIPSLPETISNVWTDAELTTNMSMTYKQDVNVVIAGLTAQIAALNGTTASNDVSSASQAEEIDMTDNDVAAS